MFLIFPEMKLSGSKSKKTSYTSGGNLQNLKIK